MADTPSDGLDLQQAADELGVHYQTVYRWVRNGRLPAVLVDGKYTVERASLDRVARERTVSARPAPPSSDRLRRQVEPMHTALVGGDEAAARRIARTLVDQGTPVVDLIQEVIAPPLRRIGQAWHDGELSIWVEHRASAMVERILGDVATVPRGRRRGTAMVAAVSGDRHSLPTAMAAVALRDANWNVHHLGADMPPDELVEFCTEHGVDVAVISSTNPDVADLAAETGERLRTAGVPTIVGGAGETLDGLLQRAAELRRAG